MGMTARGVKLTSSEANLYKVVRHHERLVRFHQAEIDKARDKLLVRLYSRLTDAVQRCASLLQMSKYQVTKDIRRLEEVGRLVRKRK